MIWILSAGCSRTPESVDPPERVFIVAVESLSASRLTTLIDEGELPTFRRVVEGGTWVEAESSLPLEPVSLWNTVFTGKLPHQHQAVGPFVTLANGHRTPAPSTVRRGKTLWRILSEHRHLMALSGIPGSWPVETLNGFTLSNGALPTRWMQTSETTFQPQPGFLDTFPANLFDEVEGLIHDARDIPREVVSEFFTLQEDEFKRLYDEPIGSVMLHNNPLKDFAVTYSTDLSYMDVAVHLLDTYDPRVVAVHLELLGALQPVFWAFTFPDEYQTPSEETRRLGGAVDRAYRWVDLQLSRLVERMGPHDTLIVTSASGFESVRASPNDRPRSLSTANATMILYGQGIRKGHRLEGASIADLTPTVLALLGVELAQDMDGQCLTQALTPGFAAANPRTFRNSYDEGWDQSDRYPGGLGVSPAEDASDGG